jgi:hypothetical protein
MNIGAEGFACKRFLTANLSEASDANVLWLLVGAEPPANISHPSDVNPAVMVAIWTNHDLLRRELATANLTAANGTVSWAKSLPVERYARLDAQFDSLGAGQDWTFTGTAHESIVRNDFKIRGYYLTKEGALEFLQFVFEGKDPSYPMAGEVFPAPGSRFAKLSKSPNAIPAQVAVMEEAIVTITHGKVWP